MAGFNIPPQIFSRDEFKKGAQIFLSADGHAARYFVQSALNPATTEAMDQVNDILRVADSARPNTELEDATIGLAGVPTALRDIRDYYNSDMKFIVIATIVIVFLILVILLRALVAPIYLIGSVLISYLSALGIGTLVFQLILGQEMHWSLPGLSFILLVAIGADYNMLLISRIRDESPHGIRIGVIRTVGSTGGVITSAGLIFAASMFGLVGASINTMAQAGFTIGIGIVLDTFLVRTVTVPALTTMIGRANWWPSELGRDPSTPPTKADRWLRRVKGHRRKAPIPAPKPPHTKVVRNTNGHASKAATKSVPNGKPADLAEGNGEYLIDHLRRHSLPLFGYAAMPAYDVVDGVSKPNGDGAHIGKEPVDHLLGHSLPLFGLAGLPSYDRWDDTSIGEPAVGHAGSKPDAKLST
ncbi:transmembrane transport protein mmpL12 [Mycobacterium tuberculosis RGTB423]